MYFIYSLPKTRKGYIILLIALILIFAFFTGLFYFQWIEEQKILTEVGQPDFNSLPINELKADQIVKGDIGLAIDVYSEEYEEGFLGTRASDESDALYYLIPVYTLNEDGYANIQYFMTYKALPEEFDIMDDIVASTWSDNQNMKVLSLDYATISELDEEVWSHLQDMVHDENFYEGGSFIDWCIENNTFDSSNEAFIESKFVPYELSRKNTPTSDLWLMKFFLFLIILQVILLLVFIFYKKEIKGIDTKMY